jgi:hypothetical protein
VDGSNDVIVTGYSCNSGADFLDAWDWVTIKYSGAGVPLWTNRHGGPGNYFDCPYRLAVDANQNVIISGESRDGSLGDPRSKIHQTTFKCSSSGEALWTNCWSWLPGCHATAGGLAVDHHGNVIVNAASPGTNTSTIQMVYATIKYSAAGVPLWTNCYNGMGSTSTTLAPAVTDHCGNVIVGGPSIGSGTNRDFGTIQYSFPLLFDAFQQTNGGFTMRIENLQPGALAIEASANLVDWDLVFTTNLQATDAVVYTEPPRSDSHRFYRAWQVQ